MWKLFRSGFVWFVFVDLFVNGLLNNSALRRAAPDGLFFDPFDLLGAKSRSVVNAPAGFASRARSWSASPDPSRLCHRHDIREVPWEVHAFFKGSHEMTN